MGDVESQLVHDQTTESSCVTLWCYFTNSFAFILPFSTTLPLSWEMCTVFAEQSLFHVSTSCPHCRKRCVVSSKLHAETAQHYTVILVKPFFLLLLVKNKR